MMNFKKQTQANATQQRLCKSKQHATSKNAASNASGADVQWRKDEKSAEVAAAGSLMNRW
jgi:hypothetical protein